MAELASQPSNANMTITIPACRIASASKPTAAQIWLGNTRRNLSNSTSFIV